MATIPYSAAGARYNDGAFTYDGIILVSSTPAWLGSRKYPRPPRGPWPR